MIDHSCHFWCPSLTFLNYFSHWYIVLPHHGSCSRRLWFLFFDAIGIFALTNSKVLPMVKHQKALLSSSGPAWSFKQSTSSKSDWHFELIAGVIELDSRYVFFTSSTVTRNPHVFHRVCFAARTLPLNKPVRESYCSRLLLFHIGNNRRSRMAGLAFWNR